MNKVSPFQRVVCLVAAITLCGSTATMTERAQHGAPWDVQLIMSGGFLGLDSQIDVASSGRIRVIDRRIKKHVDQTATGSELAALEKAILKIAPDSTTPKPAFCNDCIQYAVTVTAGPTKISLTLDDTNLGPSGLAPIVWTLVAMQQRALAPAERHQ